MISKGNLKSRQVFCQFMMLNRSYWWGQGGCSESSFNFASGEAGFCTRRSKIDEDK